MTFIYSSRFSPESLSVGDVPDPKGRLFFNGAAITDLSNVLICGSSVDTVRQLFDGIPSQRMLDKLESHVQAKQDIISLYDVVYDVLPGTIPRIPVLSKVVYKDSTYDRWHFSRMGKNSGYRYKLQNNQIGIVILFGSFYSLLDRQGQHLKIELSPHFIESHTTQELWDYLHDSQYAISKLFLSVPEPKGIAVHLACDYQGFDLPADFISKFTTSSRIVRAYDGISHIDISDLTESTCTYGSSSQAKNYLIGKPVAIQFTAYDKGYESIKSDKIDYFNDQWGHYTEGEHNPNAVTRRIELRFHHTVIREMGLGLGYSFESFPDIVPYLTDIWRHGMERNRLNQDKKHISPFWQLLIEDVKFFHPSKNIQITRKKKDSVDPISRNITSIIGNAITICARKGMKTNAFMAMLRALPIYPEIISYYERRGLTEEDLKEQVNDGLLKRKLIGNAA